MTGMHIQAGMFFKNLQPGRIVETVFCQLFRNLPQVVCGMENGYVQGVTKFLPMAEKTAVPKAIWSTALLADSAAEKTDTRDGHIRPG